MRFHLSFILLLWLAVNCAAQLPPIFADTKREIVSAKTIAEFPVNTFLENIAVDTESDLYINSYEEGKIYRVSPDGKKSDFAKIDGKIAGLAFDKQQNLIVTGWARGTTPSVFRVDRRGMVETLTAIDGAMFLNGITPLINDRFLIADSYKGVIWEFDAKTKKYSIWLADETLLRRDNKNGTPGVNGLKIRGSVLYATNTQNQKIFRIPLLAGNRAGKPELFVDRVNGDDFAFDSSGNLFLTTHVYNSVLKITPSGTTSIIAENGNVTGDTSLAFGRGKYKNTIFVVTNGGMSLPLAEGVQPAKVVRIDIVKK